jgi:hypothetical protein
LGANKTSVRIIPSWRQWITLWLVNQVLLYPFFINASLPIPIDSLPRLFFYLILLTLTPSNVVVPQLKTLLTDYGKKISKALLFKLAQNFLLMASVADLPEEFWHAVSVYSRHSMPGFSFCNSSGIIF